MILQKETRVQVPNSTIVYHVTVPECTVLTLTPSSAETTDLHMLGPPLTWIKPSHSIKDIDKETLVASKSTIHWKGNGNLHSVLNKCCGKGHTFLFLCVSCRFYSWEMDTLGNLK